MEAIWKSPWGAHIDLSRILEVSSLFNWERSFREPKDQFEIHYQLRDKPVVVDFMITWDKQGVCHAQEYRDLLVEAWQKYKLEHN